MINNRVSQRNFKPHLDYKRGDTKTHTKVYLTKTKIGKCIKIIILLIAEQLAGLDVWQTRNFPNKKVVTNRLRTMLPWIDAFYNEQGVELTETIIYNRYHKPLGYDNFAKTRDGRGKLGSEHYSNDERLVPLVESVETLFRSGLPISREQLESIKPL